MEYENKTVSIPRDISGVTVLSEMQQDDFEYLRVPVANESVYLDEMMSNQLERTKISISPLPSDESSKIVPHKYCYIDNLAYQARSLADDDTELELDLARLVERCDDDMTLAVSVLGAFIIQGAACCSEFQQFLEAGQQSHLQFQAVRD